MFIEVCSREVLSKYEVYKSFKPYCTWCKITARSAYDTTCVSYMTSYTNAISNIFKSSAYLCKIVVAYNDYVKSLLLNDATWNERFLIQNVIYRRTSNSSSTLVEIKLPRHNGLQQLDVQVFPRMYLNLKWVKFCEMLSFI